MMVHLICRYAYNQNIYMRNVSARNFRTIRAVTLGQSSKLWDGLSREGYLKTSNAYQSILLTCRRSNKLGYKETNINSLSKCENSKVNYIDELIAFKPLNL